MGLNSVRTSLNKLLFCLALFSTMPIVSIPIAGKTISFFTILLPVTFLALLSKGIKTRRIDSKPERLFLSFLLISILCSLFGALYFYDIPGFTKTAINTALKTSVFLILGYLIFSKRLDRLEVEDFAKGLLAGAVINLIWASIDGFVFYFSGISINNEVFSYYINTHSDEEIRYGMISLVLPGTGIRASGFNYDPAHIGMLAPFVFAYSYITKKRWLTVLVLMSLIFSQSSTALVTCLIIVVLFNMFNTKYMKATLGVVLVGVFALFILSRTPAWDSIQGFITRTQNKFEAGTENLRIIYNFEFPKAIINSPINLILGTGFGTASYPFYKAGLIRSPALVDPENTYISYLFDIGLIGLTVYCMMIIILFKRVWDRNKGDKSELTNSIIFSGVVSVIITCFFYHYILYATSVLIIIVGSAWCGLLQRELKNTNET